MRRCVSRRSFLLLAEGHGIQPTRRPDAMTPEKRGESRGLEEGSLQDGRRADRRASASVAYSGVGEESPPVLERVKAAAERAEPGPAPRIRRCRLPPFPPFRGVSAEPRRCA